ncbi:MAG: hypothetical protein Kow0077_23070 [Anaerolineae bacterium]
MTTIELTINELRIEGISDFEAQRIGQALERELVRLLEDRGLPHPTEPQAAVSAPLPADLARATPDQIGVAIARAVYQVLQP